MKILIVLLLGVVGAFSYVLVMLFGSGEQENEGAASAGAEPSEYAEVVGKKGTAATTLRPGGFVVVDGKRMAATSEGNFIESAEAVDDIGVKGNDLVVRTT